MLVRQILNGKPDTKILSVVPHDPVGEAVRVLSDNRIGAVVVFGASQKLEGILSERDVVRELGRKGPDALMTSVGELMTSDVISCTPADTAVSVLEKMTEGRFRHMPVMEEGKMVGLISIGDVVKARIDEVEIENSALTEMIAGNV